MKRIWTTDLSIGSQRCVITKDSKGTVTGDDLRSPRTIFVPRNWPGLKRWAAKVPFDGEPAARQQVSAALFFDSHLFPTLVFTPSSDRGSRRMGHKLRAYRAGIFLVLLVSSLASVRLVDAENWSGQRGAIPIYRRGSGKVPEFREPARR
jgi:hypothetical protein